MKEEHKTKAQLIAELRTLRARIRNQCDNLRSIDPDVAQDEGRFRKIFEHSNDAIFVIDPFEDEVLDCNRKACSMLGYSRPELLSLSVSAIHPKEMPALQAFARSVFTEGSGWTNELTCLTKNGTTLPAEISASVIDMANKTAMIALVRDISERKRAEKELGKARDELERRVEERTAELLKANTILEEQMQKHKQIENALRAVTEGTAAVTGSDFFRSLVHHLSSTLQTRLVFVTECTDVSRTRLRTLAFFEGGELKENIEYDVAGTACEKVIAGKVCVYPEKLEQLYPKEAGFESYVGVPLLDSSGKLVGHLAVLDDKPIIEKTFYTSVLEIFAARAGAELERKRAEEALRESEERFRSGFEHASIGMAMTAADGRFSLVNQSFCRMLGYSEEEMLTKRFQDITFAEDLEKSVENFQKVRQGEADSFQTEKRYVHKDGHIVWAITTASVVHDLEGKPWYLFAQIQDITARKRAEEGLRKAHDELELKVKARTAELSKANNELKKEIAERKKVEIALRESEERLACILESAMDAIVTVDTGQRIVLFNQAAENVFGCSASEAIGRALEPFLSERFREVLKNFSSQKPSTPSFWAPEGLTAIRTNGEEFPVEATVSQTKIAGRSFYTIILRDINERMKAESELNKLQQQKIYLQEEIENAFNFGEIIGASPAMKQVFKQMEKVAHTNSTVLLTGETGTGKELVARAIHNLSPRNEGVWVSVNCGALPAGLVESELFGHEKGAFTGATSTKKGRFELANEGTIFLDEVGELPLDTQVKLLRVLQEQELEPVGSMKTIKANVRVIAATNRNLEEAVRQGAFRSDLFYRLNVFPIYIPRLRERMDDVPLLANYFIRKFSSKMGKRIDSLDPAGLDKLMSYDWPGNVRELANLMERAVILCERRVIRAHHIGISTARPTRKNGIVSLEDAEREHILKALEQTRGVVGGPGGAAELLGINRSTLWSRMKKLGINKIEKVERFS